MRNWLYFSICILFSSANCNLNNNNCADTIKTFLKSEYWTGLVYIRSFVSYDGIRLDMEFEKDYKNKIKVSY